MLKEDEQILLDMLRLLWHLKILKHDNLQRYYMTYEQACIYTRKLKNVV